MAAWFLDSSALVKRYVKESGTAWVISQTDAVGVILFTTRITGVEVISGLVRKAKSGGLSPAEVALAVSRFRQDFPAGFDVMDINTSLVTAAMHLVEKHALRAYDAVQLAAIMTVNDNRTSLGLTPVRLMSADTDLNQAAVAEGLAVDNPNTHP